VLRVPPSWWQFDVWRANRTGDLARLIDARIAETPQLAHYRSTFLRLMREAAKTAEANGAQLCVVSGDLVEEDGAMLAAMGMVFQTDGAPDPVDNTVEAIAGQVNAVAPSDGSRRWRRVEIIDIDAGRAVRVYGVHPVQFNGPDRTADVVMMQTLIPIPGGGGILNVVLTSPQVASAQPMLDLFDAISSTLSWSSIN